MLSGVGLGVIFVLIFGVSSQSNDTIYVGPITITENGSKVTRHVVSTWAAGSTTSGSSITMENGANVQIASYASDTYDPDMFVKYNLEGATVSFTADYSGLSCSCNGAFYFVTMPALDSNGDATGGEYGNYYCDANDVNGEWCWEMDVMEANMYTSATTPHKCYQTPGSVTYSCDTAGCPTNCYYDNNSGFCPSSSCVINTKNSFDFSIEFGSSQYSVTMSQNGENFNFDACTSSSYHYDSNYISDMNTALSYGMTLVLSSWGSTYSTMSWLDSMTGCTGDCDTTGTLTFSDISITSGNGGKTPLYVDYKTFKQNIIKARQSTNSSLSSLAKVSLHQNTKSKLGFDKDGKFKIQN